MAGQSGLLSGLSGDLGSPAQRITHARQSADVAKSQNNTDSNSAAEPQFNEFVQRRLWDGAKAGRMKEVKLAIEKDGAM